MFQKLAKTYIIVDMMGRGSVDDWSGVDDWGGVDDWSSMDERGGEDLSVALVLGQGGVRGGVTLLVVLRGGTDAQHQQGCAQDLQEIKKM
jgi:hypothetical protein